MDWIFEEGHIYCSKQNGGILAEATFYYKNDGLIDIDHTYVDPNMRGQGIAGELMKAVSDYIRKKGVKATASCSYASAWLKKNIDEYSDIISEELNDESMSCRIDGKH